jgi:hypothetical protein
MRKRSTSPHCCTPPLECCTPINSIDTSPHMETIVPSEAEVKDALQALQQKHPDMGIKKLTESIRGRHPSWKLSVDVSVVREYLNIRCQRCPTESTKVTHSLESGVQLHCRTIRYSRGEIDHNGSKTNPARYKTTPRSSKGNPKCAPD